MNMPDPNEENVIKRVLRLVSANCTCIVYWTPSQVRLGGSPLPPAAERAALARPRRKAVRHQLRRGCQGGASPVILIISSSALSFSLNNSCLVFCDV